VTFSMKLSQFHREMIIELRWLSKSFCAFFEKSSSIRSKCGGFVTGGVAKEMISRTLRLSGGRRFPWIYSGILSMA